MSIFRRVSWTVSTLSIAALSVLALAISSGAASAPKLDKFQAIASGTLNLNSTYSDCGLTCSTGDLCYCFQFAGPISGNLIGTSTLTMNTSQDANTTIASGTHGVRCSSGSGVGTITAKSGDTLSFDFYGQFCTDAQVARLFNGVYRVNGGTGKFSSTFGGGSLDYGEITPGGSNTPVTLTGALAK
ncbi:MAG TPA: hypothetical protein VMV27_05345 [Candidatus Binataceae bacterium]|nr:hypothetical protein [Candidatus Binataceae bacterium]